MVQWNFNAEEAQEMDFAPIPIGDHRVRIADVEETTSSKGNDMLKITLDVSGYGGKLWYYLVLMPDNTKMVNQKLGQIFNSFGIQPGNMNTQTWKGKVGAARVKHELYNGENSAKVSYFLSKEKQEQLPPWQEAPGAASVNGSGNSNGNGNGFVPVNDSDIPF